MKGEKHMQHYPLIGISGNHRQDSTEQDRYLLSYAPNGFITGLEKAKAIPIILPIVSKKTAYEYISRVDALVLSGGQDVSPLLYGEEPHLKLGRTYPIRDTFDLALIEEAYRQQKPILAICRGFQILNVAFGGTLYQDLQSQYTESNILHLQKTMPSMATHSIEISKDSELAKVLGTKAAINSYHHQGIKKLAPNFKAVAWSTDGLIEAFESNEKNHYVIALQGHPEAMINNDHNMQNIFNHFVQSVQNQI